MDVIGFFLDLNANTNMKQNTSFKATAEIHVFIDFDCAAIFGGRPRSQ